ncbi:MAG: PBP1A family penicillin-binding protein [Clostridiales bacterium]|nr:PBP1A family penicillin-binding protein [Clostridiales bacterium]
MAENKNDKKKKKQKKHRVKNPFVRGILTAIKLMFLLIVIAIFLLLVFFCSKYGKSILAMQKDAKQLVAESTEKTFRQAETSIVYGSNKKVISTLKGERDSYYVNYEDIPDEIKEAMIATEDKNFNKHHGVDIVGTTRAAVELVKNKGRITQGGSTITQQLAKLTFLTNERSWERKVKEIFIALELEKKYDKYQILEFYLNNIYFNNGYYGIKAASKGYFNKNLNDLSLSQMCFLCAIPNNPSMYNPLENFDNTISRRDRILKQMKDDGWITESEYNEAVNEEIKLKRGTVKKKNYVETYVYSCATKALMKEQGFTFRNTFTSSKDRKNYNEEYDEMYTRCQKELYTGGYRIYTSIDMEKQKQLQKQVDESLSVFTDKTEDGIYKLQGAAVCIDNSTGKVVAIVGGRSQSVEGYTLNRAFQSYRQPGSSIKPLVVYTPAFEAGYTPDSIVVDKKIENGPSNADGRYSGSMKIRNAVAKSKNSVAWQLFEELTPRVGISYLYEMNFNRIVNEDYVPAAALGGLTNGVSPVEMASAYATLENDGVYRDPSCIISINNSKGEEVVAEDKEEKTVYEQNAARMMVSCMQSVMREGTGYRIRLSNMSCAGKTGTTNGSKDGWFVGFTPYYTTSVWVGYDIPQTLSSLQGASYPGQIWNAYMMWLNDGLEDVGFPDYVHNGNGLNLGEEEEKVSSGAVNIGNGGEEEDPEPEPEETEDPDPEEEDPGESEPEPEPTEDPDDETGGEDIPVEDPMEEDIPVEGEDVEVQGLTIFLPKNLFIWE